jgi:DNA processing protein
VARPPASLVTSGGSLEADRVVAIVGSRVATTDASGFATTLASRLVQRGAVVVSGGALGIDGAAHRGALAGGGRTWVVCGTGCNHVFPTDHAALFVEVARSAGAMVWPFGDDVGAMPYTFLARNHILVALADAVVVVQAGKDSGALHAAGCAHKLGRPLWVCAPPPWVGSGFDGSRWLLGHARSTGARPLHHEDDLFASLGLGPAAPRAPVLTRALSDNETAILGVTSTAPLHLDAIASRAGLPTQAAAAALLTLALENVVVEGPPGFFRDATADR